MMKQLIATVVVALAATAIARLLPRRRQAVRTFANIGEGTFGHGKMPLLGDTLNAPQTSGRYLLVKTSTDANHFTTTTTNDVPLGINQDVYDPNNTDVPNNIAILGNAPGTLRVVTDGTCLHNGYVKCGTLGRATAATTGDAGIFGIAYLSLDLTGSAAGDVITVRHTLPAKYSF